MRHNVINIQYCTLCRMESKDYFIILNLLSKDSSWYRKKELVRLFVIVELLKYVQIVKKFKERSLAKKKKTTF